MAAAGAQLAEAQAADDGYRRQAIRGRAVAELPAGVVSPAVGAVDGGFGAVAWRDDLQEDRVLDLQYWHATGASMAMVPVLDSEGRAQLFGDVADKIRPLRSV